MSINSAIMTVQKAKALVHYMQLLCYSQSIEKLLPVMLCKKTSTGVYLSTKLLWIPSIFKGFLDVAQINKLGKTKPLIWVFQSLSLLYRAVSLHQHASMSSIIKDNTKMSWGKPKSSLEIPGKAQGQFSITSLFHPVTGATTRTSDTLWQTEVIDKLKNLVQLFSFISAHCPLCWTHLQN